MSGRLEGGMEVLEEGSKEYGEGGMQVDGGVNEG